MPPEDTLLRQPSREVYGFGQDRLIQFVENSPNPIFALDAERLVRAWNPACESTFLYSREEILGETIELILVEEEKQSFLAKLAEVFSSGRTYNDEEIEFQRKDGAVRFMVTRLYPLIDHSGNPELCIVANTDITNRRQYQETLKREFEELRVLHNVAIACAEAKNEDELIDQVTEIIGKTVFPDNFGILFVDEAQKIIYRHRSYREQFSEAVDVMQLDEGICGKVIRLGCAMRVDDVSLEPAYFEVDPRTRSELCVPMKTGDRIIGVVNAESARLQGFDENDERLLTILAGQLAGTIERLRVEMAERQRVQELQAITRISQEVTSLLDLQSVLDLIVRYAAEISCSDASGLFLLQPDGSLKLSAAFGVSDPFIRAINLNGVSRNGSALGNAIQLGRPYQIPNINEDPTYEMKEIADLEGIHAILALPMLRGKKMIGGIVLWNRQPRTFSREEEQFIHALANQSVNAVENARIFEAERAQRKLAEVMRDTGAALSTFLDLDILLDNILLQLEHLIPYDAANVMFLEGKQFRVARARGYENLDSDFPRIIENLTLDIQSASNLAHLVETQQPYIVADVRRETEWVWLTPYYPIRSWIGAPILIQGEVTAIFSLDKFEPDYYQAEHAERLAIFAGQVGLALHNARLFEETQSRLREVTLLSKVIELTASATDIETALSNICHQIALFFDSPQVIFFLLDKNQAHCKVMACYPILNSGCDHQVFSLEGLDPAAFLASEARAQPLTQISSGENSCTALQEVLKARGMSNAILVPVRISGLYAAILCIESVNQVKFSQAEQDLIQDIVNQISQSLERMELFNAIQDQASRMAELAIVSRELNRPLTVQEVVRGIGEGAMTLGKADHAAFFLVDENKVTSCPWSTGLSEEWVLSAQEQFHLQPGSNIFQSFDPVLIPDLQMGSEDQFLHIPGPIRDFKSIGIWPLIYEGVVVAGIALCYDNAYQWSNAQLETLLAFTRQAAIALQNTRLFNETRRRALHQEILNKIIAEAARAPHLKDLVETVLDLTMDAINVHQGGLWVSGYKALRNIPESLGLTETKMAKRRGAGTAGTLAVPDWQQIEPGDPLFRWAELLSAHQIRATLSVPVLSGGNRIGGLSLASSEPRAWLGEEIRLIEAVGKQIGAAAERLELIGKTQEQARQMQLIIDTVPEGVLLLDAQKRIVQVNPAAKTYLSSLLENPDLSKPLTHLAGQPIQDLFAQTAETSWRELQTEREPTLIFEIAVRPLEVMTFNAGWVLVLRDVTSERAALAHTQMQERLATVGQLAAGIAHDFNNIMAAIMVYTDLLAIEPELNENNREQIRIIQQQVQRATSLIRQILDFSRRSVMEPSPLDLLPFIKELDKLLGRTLPENIILRLSYQPGVYMIKADPTRLQQIFMNLALNARDAMPLGGVLQFALNRVNIQERERPPLLDLTPGSWIQLSISDTGVGIPENILPHIFDPFYTTKPTGKGTGLGLAQVYGIVKQHGGCIDVESVLGEGTTFRLFFPEFYTSIEARESQDLSSKLIGEGERILIVEDDPTTREALQTLLESRNYQVAVSENGLDALQVFESVDQSIDLVISDMVMPGMGGLTLYYALRDRYKDVKILFITGHPLDMESQSLLEESHIEWLQKPFNVQEFIQTIQKLLNSPA